MVKRSIIGDKQTIIADNQENDECKALILTIADKDLTDLQTWFNAHFSQLTQNEQDGLMTIVETLWAISKVLKKIWRIVKWIRTLR